ncbi:MAG: DNA mismatch repair endonuclease MutL [Bacteroidales bacterium]|nr:DNA mismatch repair endonuclease MutL [Bacteroidales bacterium]
MPDIINLLPDSVANQIAAGEVIQRPASAVKELMENAVDAGASEIKLIIKDAGKTLIQVIDNGCGMSPTDARMSFERHATSKIRNPEDLFHIRTMGFRGEALASIAAIAQVELKTKLHDKDIGTKIVVEGSRLITQNEEVTNSGTSFAIRNLFFNTPARRNFLKSDGQENRHITEEFIRVALIHPEIHFSYTDNSQQKFLLTPGSFKQRIVALFGKQLLNKLLAVEESTTVVEIQGFVGKPETARKTRGEQYFFVNERFIKHPYLNHAVIAAFDDLIPDGSFPTYFLHLKVDPELIDVNIHPTKTEVNFRDEKAIYSILRAAVKMSLGKFSLSPQIDFDVETSINLTPPPPGTPIRPPQVRVNPNYNPFENEEDNRLSSASNFQTRPSQGFEKPQQNWEQLFEKSDFEKSLSDELSPATFSSFKFEDFKYESLNNEYLVAVSGNGLLIVDRRAAHERVLYDRFAAMSEAGRGASQRKIFTEILSFSAPDAELVVDLLDDLLAMGFEIIPRENNDFEVVGAPPDLADEPLQSIIEGMLDFYKLNKMELRIDRRRNLLLSMARNLSIRPGQSINNEEVQALMQALSESSVPSESPSGKKVFRWLNSSEISQLFKS